MSRRLVAAGTRQQRTDAATTAAFRLDEPVTTTERIQDERTLRCAMFVDFDNVYLGLRRLDPEAAEAFATEPAHWLAQLTSATGLDGPFTRRFLVRACYLNPSVFSRFRPNFTRAGFQVVDCPSLTQQGKSSADINLVLDAVDALTAPTRYDEFVIVSADADFTFPPYTSSAEAVVLGSIRPNSTFVNERFMALHMMIERMRPEEPSSAPAIISK